MPAEPDRLFEKEIRAFHHRHKQGESLQMDLPLPGESNPIATPPREDPGFAAFRIWYRASATWWILAPKFQIHAWRVLCFLACGGRPAVDLTRSNPGLAWLLASVYFQPGWEQSPEKVDALCASLGKKQRELLTWLDLPDSPWVVGLMNKLSCDVDPAECLPKLRTLVQSPYAAKIFQHLPAMTRKLFDVMREEIMPFISHRFLTELLHANPTELNLGLVQSLLSDVAAHAGQGNTVPRFQSLRHLERWHWDMLASQGLHSVGFPTPPYTGTKWILPITHSHMLQRESKEMRHCVVTYEKEILRGDVAIYVVLHPQRATLGLQKNRDGTWGIFDFRLPFNRCPSSESRRTVEAWLSKAQAG